MKKILALALAAVLVLSMAACGGNGSNGGKPGKNSITVGALTLTDMGKVTGNPGFVSGDVLQSNLINDGAQILDLNGNLQNETVYAKIESLAGTVVVVSGKDLPAGKNLGIVDKATGKELVPCELANVTAISNRYLLLTYMEEPSTKDDYFHYYFDENRNMCYINGYGLIFDREQLQIVPNVKVTDSYVRASAAGSTILTKESDNTIAYNANGEKLGSSRYLYAFDNAKLLMEQTADGVVVYDGDFKKISTLDGSISDFDTLDGVSDMLLQRFPVGDDTAILYYEYRLVDLQGALLSQAYTQIANVFLGKYVSHYDSDTQQSGLTDLEGNALLPLTKGHYSYIEPGYFLKQEAGSYAVYNSDGTVIAENVYQADDAVFYKNQSSRDVLVLSTGNFLPAGERTDALTKSLVRVDSKLYDTISGQVVLEDVDNCVCTGENLYVWDKETDTYTRYLVSWAK